MVVDQDDIFVNWPHAVDQFIERGGFPARFDKDSAMRVLKELVTEAFRDGQEKLTNVRNQDKQDGLDKFVFRIQIPHRQVVYPVLEKGKPGGKYLYMIHTVLDQEMYQSWSRERKLGTLGDKLPQLAQIKEQVRTQEVKKKVAERKEQTKKKESGGLLLDWPAGDHSRNRKFVTPDELEKEVLQLLMDGVSIKEIEVYKRIPLKLSTINISTEEG